MDDLTTRIQGAADEMAAQARPQGLRDAMQRAAPGSAPPPPRMRPSIDAQLSKMDLPDPAPAPAAKPASDREAAIAYHRGRLSDLEREAIRFGAEIERDIRGKQAIVDELDRAYREKRDRYDREIADARRALDSRLGEISKLAEASRAALGVLAADDDGGEA